MKERLTQPLVSICLPVYNGAGRMHRAVDSLLGQTYPHIELILSDNCSTDSTPHICETYKNSDARVRFFRQQENIGQVRNMFASLQEARGEYVMLASDDDWWHPRFIEDVLSLLLKYPHHGVAMSSFARTDDEGNIKSIVSYAGDLDLTKKNYCAVARRMIMRAPIHIFLYGIYRREALMPLLKRPAPACLFWDRIFMTEAALSFRFATLPEVRFHKTYSSRPAKKRLSNEAIGAAYRDPLAYSHYLGMFFRRVWASDTIPVRRKPCMIIPWLCLCWHFRRSLIFEWRRLYHAGDI